MADIWTSEDLHRIGSAEELEIAVRRADGTLRRWVPIWVVCVGEQVFVRTWHRRTTGWFGQVLDSRRASIRVPGLQADVAVEDLGDRLRADVDAAYQAKYGRYGAATIGRMVSDEAAEATLRLAREG